MLDIEKIRDALQQEESRLIAEISSEAGKQRLMGEDTGEEGPGEVADDASELAEREKGLGIEGALERMLAEVRQALHKLDAGTYGLCDGCGQPIAEERLRARPQATLCISCKAKLEHVQTLHEARFTARR